MSTGAEHGQYVLQTLNSKKFEDSVGVWTPPPLTIPSGYVSGWNHIPLLAPSGQQLSFQKQLDFHTK